jgi:hypothetical protein
MRGSIRYRALAGEKHAPSADHIVRKHPEWTMKYGHRLVDGPRRAGGASSRPIAVMLDVTRRYDVDGIHIDDYFYPYPITDAKKQKIEFPDDSEFWPLQSAGGHAGTHRLATAKCGSDRAGHLRGHQGGSSAM